MSAAIDPLVVEPLGWHPEALEPVASWIDSEWGAFSGRTLLQTRERFAGEVAGQLPITLVALVDGLPHGVASLRERDSRDWDPASKPWICNVYVDPEARGRGIAARLCIALEEEARRLGFTRAFLASLRPEGSLYEQIGYRTYGWADMADGRMFVMEKMLCPVEARSHGSLREAERSR